jgi:RNA polymerase sigma-70 factor, ECF subfamily
LIIAIEIAIDRLDCREPTRQDRWVMTTRPAAPLTSLADAELTLRAGMRADPGAAESAFRTLYDRHSPSLFAFLAARLERSEAEDVLQDAWLRIWKALGEPGRFDGKDFRAWAFEIARNLVTDRQRRKGLSPQSLEGDGQGRPIDPVDHRTKADPYAEHRAILARCLERLSPDERSVVQARLDGAKPEALAEKAKVKPERIYKLLHQAKAKLTACVEGSKS